ncbi:MAG: sulfotransferase family protein [Rhodothermales bacterium]
MNTRYLPTFLLIGAAKAGTTSLYDALGQHPEIYTSPIKEPSFFAFGGTRPDYQGPGDAAWLDRIVRDLDAYQALFRGRTTEKAAGEGSHWYLYSEKAPAYIRRYVPDVRLVAVLRDPADRAYSTYLHLRRTGQETLPSFEEALRQEAGRVAKGWGWGHYVRRGRYGEQLRRYYDHFRSEQIRVYLYQDLQRDPYGLLRDLYRFLGVRDDFVPDLSVHRNVSGLPKHPRLHRLLRASLPLYRYLRPLIPTDVRRAALRRYNRDLAKPPFPPALRRQIIAQLRDDILQLQTLIDQDLGAWMHGENGELDT